MVKPFAFSELLARLRALLRREALSKDPQDASWQPGTGYPDPGGLAGRKKDDLILKSIHSGKFSGIPIW
jgi:DNA-binding response OmpR family regulator